MAAMALRPDRRVMVTRRVASLMNGSYNFIIFIYQMAYGFHFSHSNAHISAISSFTPSPFFNSMPGRGSVSTVEERRQCITIVNDGSLWNALMVERASKHYGHLHTFHRSTSSVGLAGADGKFPVTRAATELMHACEETIHKVFLLLCGFFLVSVHPSGPRLAASR